MSARGPEFACEDFVFLRLRAAEWSLEALPEGLRLTMADLTAGLRLVAAKHSVYVGPDGASSGRCYTCGPAHGVPCATARFLARVWKTHPDYVKGWGREVDDPAYQTATSTAVVLVALAEGFRKLHDNGPPSEPVLCPLGHHRRWCQHELAGVPGGGQLVCIPCREVCSHN